MIKFLGEIKGFSESRGDFRSMSTFFRAFCLILPLSILLMSAGKIKVKKDTVYRPNGKVYFKTEHDKELGIWEIKSPGDSLLLVMRRAIYYDPVMVSSSNPKGAMTYYEVLPPGNDSILFEYTAIKHLTALGKYFFKYDVITEDGLINQSRLQYLSALIGKPHSRRREELSGR